MLNAYITAKNTSRIAQLELTRQITQRLLNERKPSVHPPGVASNQCNARLKTEQLCIAIAMESAISERCFQRAGTFEVEPRIKLISHPDTAVDLD